MSTQVVLQQIFVFLNKLITYFSHPMDRDILSQSNQKGVYRMT